MRAAKEWVCSFLIQNLFKSVVTLSRSFIINLVSYYSMSSSIFIVYSTCHSPKFFIWCLNSSSSSLMHSSLTKLELLHDSSCNLGWTDQSCNQNFLGKLCHFLTSFMMLKSLLFNYKKHIMLSQMEIY